MLNFCKNFIKNKRKENILNDPTLCFLLNKKELEDLYFYLIKDNARIIQHIKNLTNEMQLKAIKQNGLAIEFIENPTEQMQLEAIKQNRQAIQFIKNPTKEMKILAKKKKTVKLC